MTDVVLAAGGDVSEYAGLTETEAYDKVDEFLPKGIKAHVTAKLITLYGFPYDNVKDMDEKTGKSTLYNAVRLADSDEKGDGAVEVEAPPPKTPKKPRK